MSLLQCYELGNVEIYFYRRCVCLICYFRFIAVFIFTRCSLCNFWPELFFQQHRCKFSPTLLSIFRFEARIPHERGYVLAMQRRHE